MVGQSDTFALVIPWVWGHYFSHSSNGHENTQCPEKMIPDIFIFQL